MDNLKVKLVDGTKLHHAEVFFDTQKGERIVAGWNINNKYCSCSAENIAKFENDDSTLS